MGICRFPALDGLRAVSVLMVVAFHTHAPLWEPLQGHLGVTVFFVISGMLITTLLLLEEARDGSISVRAFYRRRWWRIVPLYLVALACFSAGIYLFHLFCVDAVARVLPEGGATAQQLVRFALIAGGSIAVAELLHRTVEEPLIAAARRRGASPRMPLPARRRAARA